MSKRILQEAANGMQVMVPEEKLEEWQKQQEMQKAGENTELTPQEEAWVRRMVERVYGKQA